MSLVATSNQYETGRKNTPKEKRIAAKLFDFAKSESIWRAQEESLIGKHWRAPALPSGENGKWLPRERRAVRQTLAKEVAMRRNPEKAPLNLPKVFIYPFPSEFTNSTWIKQNLASEYNPSELVQYWDVLGLEPFFNSKNEHWIQRGAKWEWIPSAAAVTTYRNRSFESMDDSSITCSTEKLKSHDPQLLEDDCVMRTRQHNLGPLIHRSLRVGYPLLVDDPAEADLFFIPDYAARGDSQFCNAVSSAWLSHFRRSYPGYLERNKGNDHFVILGRTVHHVQDLSYSKVAKMANYPLKNVLRSYECSYRTKWQVRRLALEVQDPLIRYCNRIHPVPYFGFMAFSTRPNFGRKWFLRKHILKDSVEKHIVAGFRIDDVQTNNSNETNNQQLFVRQRIHPVRDKAPSRTAVLRACHEMHNCHDIWYTANYTMKEAKSGKIDFEDNYRKAIFSLQPPGFSAARKGIIDSILSGTIPIIIKEEDTAKCGIVFSLEQRELWPWHWPYFRTSSIIIPSKDAHNLRTYLKDIDDEQIRLMQRVIRLMAPSFAWPLDTIVSADPTYHNLSHYYSSSPSRILHTINALTLTMHHLFAVFKKSKATYPATTLHRCKHQLVYNVSTTSTSPS